METRAQALLKNTMAVHKMDGATTSRFEAIEKAIELQNEKTSQIGERVKEKVEAFEMMMNRNTINASTSSTIPVHDEMNSGAENNVP